VLEKLRREGGLRKERRFIALAQRAPFEELLFYSDNLEVNFYVLKTLFLIFGVGGEIR
jgi:hypothetical protein